MRRSVGPFSLRPAGPATARRGGRPERSPIEVGQSTVALAGVGFHWGVIWARGYREPSKGKGLLVFW